MKGKVCVITGANRGIGKATAEALAQLGATVILACRDIERGEIAKADIISATSNPNVELMLVDLSLQESIQKMVTAFGEKHDRLDVLVNNAGVYKSQRETDPRWIGADVCHKPLRSVLADESVARQAESKLPCPGAGGHRSINHAG